jgi:hypothetical protein
MNKEKIAKMQWKQVKIRPIMRRFDPTRGELAPLDDTWQIRSASREEIELYHLVTHNTKRIGTDHIREFRTDPEGTDGILFLKSQFELRNGFLHVEPLE